MLDVSYSDPAASGSYAFTTATANEVIIASTVGDQDTLSVTLDGTALTSQATVNDVESVSVFSGVAAAAGSHTIAWTITGGYSIGVFSFAAYKSSSLTGAQYLTAVNNNGYTTFNGGPLTAELTTVASGTNGNVVAYIVQTGALTTLSTPITMYATPIMPSTASPVNPATAFAYLPASGDIFATTVANGSVVPAGLTVVSGFQTLASLSFEPFDVEYNYSSAATNQSAEPLTTGQLWPSLGVLV